VLLARWPEAAIHSSSLPGLSLKRQKASAVTSTDSPLLNQILTPVFLQIAAMPGPFAIIRRGDD